MSIIDRCPVIEFKDLGDERGKLVVVEGGQSIPFEIKRVFYIYGSERSAIRGRHANRYSEFILINVAGNSMVKISDGLEEAVINLDRPMIGVYIPQMIWKEMFNFSKDSVLLVLASTHYDDTEYIRDFNEYREMIKLVKTNEE